MVQAKRPELAGKETSCPKQGGRWAGREIAASFPCHPSVQMLQGVSGVCREEEGLPWGRGEEPWTGHWEQQEAWDRGHQLPVSLTCGEAPGHVPLRALLLQLQPSCCMRWFTSQHSLSTY